MSTSRSISARTSSKRLRLLGVAALVTSTVPAAGFVLGVTGSASAATGSVSGSIYTDTNLNGAKDSGEAPIANVWVKAFGHRSGADAVINTADDTETAYGPVKSAADGTWTISGITSDDKARIEYYGVDLNNDGTMQANEQTAPSWLQPGPQGASNGSSVQFTALNASPIVFGMANPSSYCQANPALVTACMTLGDNTTYNRAVSTFSSSLGGAVTSEATAAQVGAVNGIAAGRDGNIYAATYVKRHTEYGSAGNVNAIYRMTTGGSDTPTVFATLPGTLTAHESAKYISDDAIWPVVGKQGIGDVDIAEDGSALYAVNMGDQRLYTVPVIGSGAGVTAGSITSVAIPSPAGCVDPRPMGLGVKDGLVYVGGVCSAESGTTADLDGYVMVFNPGSATRVLDAQTLSAGAFAANEVLRFNFEYPRKQAYCSNIPNVSCLQNPWPVWNDTSPWSDGPMLSDLDFHNGDLVLGIRDRISDKAGNNAEQYGTDTTYQAMGVGDILLACRQSSGYALESNGSCTSTTNGALTGAGVGNNQGPGGGEFFFDSALFTATNGHPDAGTGAIAVRGDTVFHTAIDPTNNAYTAGVNSVSALNGSRLGGLELQPNDPSYFGKANGLGDIEVLCNAAPIEIGNRVWKDANHDGIQNGGELSFAGVTVKLYDAAGTTLLGTAVTAADGSYTFTNVGGTASTADNLVDTLSATTSYKIVVDTTQPALANWTLTTANADDATVGDNSDSDATLSGSDAVISLTTGPAGSNDHTYDFGFFQAYSLGNRVWIDDNDNSQIDAGELGAANITVELLDSAGSPFLVGGSPVTTTTDANGYYRFDNLAAGSYKVKVTGPLGYASSTTDEANPNLDVDATSSTASDNGVGTATTVTSGVVTLGALGEPTGETDLVGGANPQGAADNAANMTVDFGFYQPMDLKIGLALTTAGPYLEGQNVDCAATVTNNGPATALSGFSVTLRLATGLTWAGSPADGTNWTVTNTNGQEVTLTWGGPNLASGASASVINCHATIDTGATGTLKIESKVIPAPGDRPETILLGTANSGYETGDPTVGSNNDDAVTLTVTPTTTTTTTTTTIPVATTTTTILVTTTTLPATTTTTTPPALTYSLGNLVWIDTNNNGVVDGSEAGLDGVTVRLLDASNAIVSSQTTSSGGYYLFTGLAAGDYTVEIVTPVGYASSTGASNQYEPAPDADVNVTDSDDNGTAAGAVIRSAPVTLGGAEPTGEGATPGHPDATPDAQSNATVDFGLSPVAALGDTVWFDDNKDGIQSAGEAGVPNVQVRLRDGNGNVLATATTDANGKYLFSGLTPGVSYVVEFVKSTLPSDANTFTTMGVGAAATDSNADPTTGLTMPVVLAAGETNLTIDAGIIRTTTIVTIVTNPTTTTTTPATTTTLPSTVLTTPTTTTVPSTTTTSTTVPTKTCAIGDYVWRDFNGDGRQDPNEKPIVGAVLLLTSPTGMSLKAVTDGNGIYRFDGLACGTYTVEIQSTSNPTNGPKARNVSIQAGEYLDADFGFNRSGVQGVQIEAPQGLSVTGSPTLLLLSFALALLGFGLLTATRSKRTGRHFA